MDSGRVWVWRESSKAAKPTSSLQALIVLPPFRPTVEWLVETTGYVRCLSQEVLRGVPLMAPY